MMRTVAWFCAVGISAMVVLAATRDAASRQNQQRQGFGGDPVVTLATVAFTGSGLDGSPLYDWWDDSTNWNNQPDAAESLEITAISAPEWVRESGKNKFALQTVGVAWRVKAQFSIALPDGFSAPVAWATANTSALNMASEQSPVSLSYNPDEDVWEGTFQIASASDNLNYYDVTWTWRVRIDGHTYTDFSSHTVGVGDPESSFTYRPDTSAGPALAYAGGPAPQFRTRQWHDVADSDPLAGLLLAQAGPPSGVTASLIQKNFATISKAVLEATKGLNLATQKDEVCAAVLNSLNVFGGKYEFPNKNPAADPANPTLTDPFGPYVLLTSKTGSCSNWAYLLQLTLHGNYRISAPMVAAHTVSQTKNPPPPDWFNNAECFETVDVTPQGGAAQKYVFGDHWFLTFNGKCYDPSFKVSFNGSWSNYMRNSVIGQLALPDRTKHAVTSWVRCRAIGNPNDVFWKGFGGGNNVLNLQDQHDPQQPIQSWDLEN